MSTYLTAHGHHDRARTPAAPIDTSGSVSNAWASILGLMPEGISVTDSSVRGLPALDRAVTLVSNSVASMMVAATKEAPEAVLRRPHPLLGAFEYYSMIVRTAMMRGNSVHVVIGDGGDAQLVPVSPDAVTIDQSGGLPVYRIGDRRYRHDEVVHVRANTLPGSFVGQGIIEKFRVPLSEQLHAQKYAETTFRNGGVPSGVVTVDQGGPATPDQVSKIRTTWDDKFGGSDRKVAILTKGLSFEPISWSPHDAEFAESRRISVAEAALMAGLRPEDLGASFGGNGMTYANRSDDSIQRTIDSYGPWAEVVEQAFSDLVGRQIEADPDALLRMSPRQAEEIETIRLENELLRRQLAATTPTPTEEVDP